jgi:predicted NodU family carbamoyl transferase
LELTYEGLGLTTEEDSGAVIVEDGRIIAAINEERLSRMKHVLGFPHASIAAVLSLAKSNIEDIDAVQVGSTMDASVGEELAPFDGWFEYRPRGVSGWLKSHVALRLSPPAGTCRLSTRCIMRC